MPIQRNKKGIPAGVITRKDALVRDDIIAAARGQRDMDAANYGQSGRNGAIRRSAGRHSE